MITMNAINTLLYIRPRGPPSSKPVVDELTLRLAHQMVKYVESGCINGNIKIVHEAWSVYYCTGCKQSCVIFYILLPNGLVANTAALHYMMYHRNDVRSIDIIKVQQMDASPDPNFQLPFGGDFFILNAVTDYFKSEIKKGNLDYVRSFAYNVPNSVLQDYMSYTVTDGSPDIIKFFLQRGISPYKRFGGLPAIHEAVCCHRADIIKVLIESGVNINYQDQNGNTPLHHLLHQNKYKFAYVDRENIMEIYNRTPLKNTIDLLLSLGADPLLQNHKDKTAYTMGKQYFGQAVTNIFPKIGLLTKPVKRPVIAK